VLLDELGTRGLEQQVLLLHDAWGNRWRPPAAQLAAQLGVHSSGSSVGAGRGAAAGRQQSQETAGGSSHPFNAQFTAGLDLLSSLLAASQDTGSPAPQQQRREQPDGPPRKRPRTATRSKSATPAPAVAAAAAAVAAGNAAAGAGDADAAEDVPEPGNWPVQLVLLAGQGEQQQPSQTRLHSLPFDAQGCCSVPAQTCTQLGVGAVGEWQLAASAATVAAAAEPGQQQQQQQQQLWLPLCTWRVVAEGEEQLEAAKAGLFAQLKAVNARSSLAHSKVGGLHEKCEGARKRLDAEQAAQRYDNTAAALAEIARALQQQQALVQLQAAVAQQAHRLLCRAGRCQPLRPELLLRPLVRGSALPDNAVRLLLLLLRRV
jgi:hypothetical protein